MKIPPNSRVTNLKAMIVLEEKRAALQSQIAALDEQFASLQSALYGAAPSKEAAKPKAKAVAAIKPGRKQRGALKEQVLEALHAAGANGVTVLDLAKMLGTKPANIHSWFSANIKKVSGLKKLGGGKYVLKGKATAAVKPAKEAKPVKVAKARKAAKPAKVAKVVKAGPAKKVAGAKGPSARGELKAQILDALKEAGEGGITIKDLSAKLGAKYKNLYIWFVTTGKRIAEIKKVGPATYRLQAA